MDLIRVFQCILVTEKGKVVVNRPVSKMGRISTASVNIRNSNWLKMEGTVCLCIRVIDRTNVKAPARRKERISFVAVHLITSLRKMDPVH